MKTKAIIKFSVIVGISLLLNGCFVAKNYERPELETVDLYRNFSENDTTSIATMPWNELFTDPVLQELIARGLQNNYDLKIAYQQVLAAEAYYKQGKAGYIPIVDLSASVTSSEFADNSALGQQFANIGGNNGGGPSGRLEQYDLTTNLSWEADIWGRIRGNKRALGAAFLQSEAVRRAVQTELVASIASAYYQLLAFDAQLAIAEKTVKVRQKSFETIQSLKASGEETEVAVKQTEAQLVTAEILAIDLRLQIVLLENTLSILLGESPKEIERGQLAQQEVLTDFSVGLPSQLLRNRPDVIQAEYNLINRFELVNVARADFYPKITLSASAGFQSLAFGDWFESASFFNNLVAGLAQPLLNQRQIRTQFEVAKAQKKEALFNFKNTLLIAGQEVSNAMATYKAESEKYILRETQVLALTDAADFSTELLVNGYANYLEVLRANDEQLAAQLELINTKYLQLNAIVSLYQALGGGWQ